LQVLGDLRVDASGKKDVLTVNWLLQLALDEAIRNTDFGHLAVAEQLFKLAVRYVGDLLHARIEILDEYETKESCDPV
jgi:hypothetical protein